MAAFGDIDLNILRGWRQNEAPELRAPHALPALARLVHLESGRAEAIHAPAVLVGRYTPQNAPVDVLLEGLKDHENYRLGAPHLQILLEEDGSWWCRHLAPGTHTQLDDAQFGLDAPAWQLRHGDELVLGIVRYRFERTDTSLTDWREARARLLSSAKSPALFLCRRGAPCGPVFYLNHEAILLGRSLPAESDFLAAAPWRDDAHPPAQPDIDFAGLYPFERRHISFLHACIRRQNDQTPSDQITSNRMSGELVAGEDAAAETNLNKNKPPVRPAEPSYYFTPLAIRHCSFINRQQVSEPQPLYHGDEIGLGPVLLCLHLPEAPALEDIRAPEPPQVIDWHSDATPSLLDEPTAQPTEQEARAPDVDSAKHPDSHDAEGNDD